MLMCDTHPIGETVKNGSISVLHIPSPNKLDSRFVILTRSYGSLEIANFQEQPNKARITDYLILAFGPLALAFGLLCAGSTAIACAVIQLASHALAPLSDLAAPRRLPSHGYDVCRSGIQNSGASGVSHGSTDQTDMAQRALIGTEVTDERDDERNDRDDKGAER